MRRNGHALAAVAICSVVLSVAEPCGARAIVLTNMQAELVAVFQAWKSAVLRRDASALELAALPESRRVVRRELAVPDSPLRQSLFGSDVTGLLSDPEAMLLLFPYESLREHGNGTEVCIVGEDAPLNSVLDRLQRGHSADSRKDVFCIFMVYAEKRWSVVYDRLAFPYDDE